MVPGTGRAICNSSGPINFSITVYLILKGHHYTLNANQQPLFEKCFRCIRINVSKYLDRQIHVIGGSWRMLNCFALNYKIMVVNVSMLWTAQIRTHLLLLKKKLFLNIVCGFAQRNSVVVPAWQRLSGAKSTEVRTSNV